MTFKDLVEYAVSILGRVVPFIVLLAMAVFIWGLAMYILKSGDSKEAKRGKDIMLWGLLGFFVMISVWGLVALVRSTFDGVLDNSNTVETGPLFER